ncbi:MAG TPA: beta-ketoacyl-[acyl-carrier-protein] synthase family protein [Dissulfurispiraceae bacterium]|nr:beta-ketoacyl-[acyl-carrier-protein] synthase family protein [Dissulfurispiraceae bacterium]
MTWKRRKVVVTGLGMATSLGLEVNVNWGKALAGVSGTVRLIGPHAEMSPVQAVGQVAAQDWERVQREFPEEAAAEGERKTLFGLWSARRALEDASLGGVHGARDRYGVVFASGLGINRLEDISGWIRAGGDFDLQRFGRECRLVHGESVIRNNSHRTSALIGKRFGLLGLNATVTTACASATQAIGAAFRAVRSGRADLIVAGGADSMINPVGLVFFVLLGAASTSSEHPEAACRPFDRKRSGLVMGEGAGAVVIEEETHAVKRGAQIYAEVAGYGSSLDAHQVTAPHPQGRGAAQSMQMALMDAGLAPDEIDYINAHGTGTKLNDIAETIAIKNVFGGHARSIAVSSSKSLTGHLLAASGAPEFIFSTLSVREDQVHPTVNLTHPDPKCDLDYVPNLKKSMAVRAALSNSFGFGGQNSSIIVRKYAEGRCR